MLITSNKDVFKPALSKRIAMKATLVRQVLVERKEVHSSASYLRRGSCSKARINISGQTEVCLSRKIERRTKKSGGVLWTCRQCLC